MNYAIVEFGNIGQAHAKAFAHKGIEVSVATTRDLESFASAAGARCANGRVQVSVALPIRGQ